MIARAGRHCRHVVDTEPHAEEMLLLLAGIARRQCRRHHQREEAKPGHRDRRRGAECGNDDDRKNECADINRGFEVFRHSKTFLG
jgi:hypothetical protein